MFSRLEQSNGSGDVCVLSWSDGLLLFLARLSTRASSRTDHDRDTSNKIWQAAELSRFTSLVNKCNDRHDGEPRTLSTKWSHNSEPTP